MIIEHKHINYANNYKIITDARILKAIKKRNLIIDYDKNHGYIDEHNCYNSNKSINEFYYKNELYQIKYFDGCFNPYVIKIEGSRK